MYPTAVICLFCAGDSFCVAPRFWLPCHISKSREPGPFCAVSFPPPRFNSRVAFCVRVIQFWINACHNPVIGSSELPYNAFFAKGLACGFWLPPADIISAKGNTGLHSDTMWYDWEYGVRHIGEIGVLWVCFLLLTPPVGYVRYPKCTAKLHWVGVVIIEVWINLPPVLRCFRRQIQMEPGGSQ